MTIVVVTPTADAFIADGAAAGSAYGTLTAVATGRRASDGIAFRTLLNFDLTAIPDSATISSAVLSLYLYDNVGSSNARTVRVHRMLKTWVEASCTWTNTNGAQTDGVDREATTIGSIALSAAEAFGWKDIPLTVTTKADLGPAYGLLLQADTEAQDMHAYYSRENGNATLSPKLTITYTAGSNAARVTQFGVQVAYANPAAKARVSQFFAQSLWPTTVPRLVTLSPDHGIVGTTVTIGGALFGGSTGTVTFGGTATTTTAWNDTSITCTVPSRAAGPCSVVVTTSVGIGSLGVSFTVDDPIYQIGVADSGTGTDDVSVAVQIPLAETGIATETVTVTVYVGILDSGSGLDDVAPLAHNLAIEDSGVGTDDITLVAYVDIQDSSHGYDDAAARTERKLRGKIPSEQDRSRVSGHSVIHDRNSTKGDHP